MKSLLVLTCLMAVCFMATNAASIDTKVLRNLLLKVKEKRQDFGEVKECKTEADCDDKSECFYGFCLEKITGGGPDPIDESCKKDSDCSWGVCVKDKCQDCRANSDCGDESWICKDNWCEPKEWSQKRSLVNDLRTLVKKWQKH